MLDQNIESRFSFQAKDGYWHTYVYNRSALTSTLAITDKDNNLIKFDALHCPKEEYHIRRVMHDFNDNNATVNESEIVTLWKRDKLRFFVVIAIFVLFFPLISFYSRVLKKQEEIEC